MEEIEKAKRYLNSVDWPKGLRVRYTITRDYVVLIYVNRLDWIVLPEIEVLKASDRVNQTMTWLVSNGYNARLLTE